MTTPDPLFIVIGGGGFMGGAFMRYLAATGRKAVSVGRGQQPHDVVVNMLVGADKRCVVVDFAYTSVPNSSFNDPIKDYSENLYNVLRHVEFVRLLPNSTYIYVSSGGTVYGEPEANQPIVETHRTVPQSPYGITKLACERYVLMYHKVHGIDGRIVRPSNVYGPGQIPFRGQGIVSTVMARMIRKEKVQVYGDGSTVRDYLYIEDFCEALLDVIELGVSGEIYNIGSGQGVSINELLSSMRAELAISQLEVDERPIRPFDVQYNVLACKKLAQMNGWRPRTSIEDGISKSALWLARWVESNGRC